MRCSHHHFSAFASCMLATSAAFAQEQCPGSIEAMAVLNAGPEQEALEPTAAARLAALTAFLNDPACSASDRTRIHAAIDRLANILSDWQAVSTNARAALSGTFSDDRMGRNARGTWLLRWTTAELRLSSADITRLPTASAAIETFAAFAIAEDRRPDRAAQPEWLNSVSGAMGTRAELLRTAGDLAGAADAEKKGATFVQAFGQPAGSASALAAPDEFLFRVAQDQIALRDVSGAMATLLLIDTYPASQRPAAQHATHLRDPALEARVAAPFALAAWRAWPNNGYALRLFIDVAGATTREADAELIRVADEVLANTPETAFAEATAIRDRHRTPEEVAANRPMRAHLLLARARIARNVGDVAGATQFINQIRERGWLDGWIHATRLEAELQAQAR